MTEDTAARMKELDKKEEMMREGKVVKIEPMPNAAGGLPRPSNESKREMTREDRLRIADRIVNLSDGEIERKETDRGIRMKIGSGPYSIGCFVSTHYDRVSFFIRSTNLLGKAEAEGFKPKPAERTRPGNEDLYRFWELSLNDIEAHEALFKGIVKESVRVVMDHKRKN